MIALSEALNGFHYRALREIAVQGTANAASGLSEMVGKRIRMQTPDLTSMGIAQIPSLLKDPEATVVGIYLSVDGDVKGHILLLFSPSEAQRLVDMLMGLPPGSTKSLGGMERSALGEVGNLTGAFFLNALADATKLSGQPSPPAVMIDMGAAVMQVPLSALACNSDEALVINTLFMDENRKIEGLFLVMPDLPSMQAILEVLERRWANK